MSVGLFDGRFIVNSDAYGQLIPKEHLANKAPGWRHQTPELCFFKRRGTWVVFGDAIHLYFGTRRGFSSTNWHMRNAWIIDISYGSLIHSEPSQPNAWFCKRGPCKFNDAMMNADMEYGRPCQLHLSRVQHPITRSGSRHIFQNTESSF